MEIFGPGLSHPMWLSFSTTFTSVAYVGMCGIVVSLTSRHDSSPREDFRIIINDLQTLNASRGPDSRECISVPAKDATQHSYCMEFFASVLHLRGVETTKQPHQDQDGNIFCWNGEVFEGMEVTAEENDGSKIFSRLNAGEPVVDVMGSIEGPYAFVFYQVASRSLFFARDPLGRRSLLIHFPTSDRPHFLLASSSNGQVRAYPFEELSTEGIHVLDLATSQISQASVSFLGRTSVNSHSTSHFVAIPPLDRSVPPSDTADGSDTNEREALMSFRDVLESAVRLRVQHIPHHQATRPDMARVAVLFSGGIDCTVIAHLAHTHLPIEEPIDLLNVAFENPRSLKGKTNGGSVYDVPDRLTGREELQELRAVCPGRKWNFVEIDVPYEETQRERPRVEMLMYPNRTVMDLSLALALYFASRGIGSCEGVPYISHAKVLLSGLGSDELLGGYGRHRHAFATGGWEGLLDELQLDLDRLPSRNLGRDDRVISANGKETRYPFLSLSVVSFVAQLPVFVKLNPTMEEGVGDKRLLRLLAESLGLRLASTRKKRAMQFGSRSARMEGGDADRRGDIVLL